MQTIEFIRNQLLLEAEAIKQTAAKIDDNIHKALELLYNCQGKVVVTGMGKTGLIGRKIAATLASTGTTAIFLHPAEGIHGDLGMLQKSDVIFAISNSGNTQELVSIIPYIKFLGCPIIALTGNLNSTLAKNSDAIIDCSVPREFEPFGLVPTASTTVALAIGDAISVALLERRNFKITDFALFHPGGTIGRKMLLTVNELMHQGTGNPIVMEDLPMDKVILEMTSKGLGCANVINSQGYLVGIVTDGDLRRFLNKGDISLQKAVKLVMTVNPKTLKPECLAVEALNLMEKFNITMLPVVDNQAKPIGLLHMHDLIKAGVVS